MVEEQADFEVIQPGAIDVIERAQIDMQIATARRYPRDVVSVKKKITTLATMDEETAASCFFTLERYDYKEKKKKLIPGPSVRLAEIAVYAFGNTRSGARVTDNDGRMITAQGMCHDLESNNLISMSTQRRITNKDGKTFTDDMQVVTGNAASAIAWRNAVLKVIPRSLYWSAYEAARMVAVGDATTLREKRDKIVKRFASMGVSLEQVLAKVDKRRIDDIGLEELEALIGIGTKIKEGHSSVDEEFEPTASATGSKSSADRAGVEALMKVDMAAARKMAADLKLDWTTFETSHSRSDGDGGQSSTGPQESSAPSGQGSTEARPPAEATVTQKLDPQQEAFARNELVLKDLQKRLQSLGMNHTFWNVVGQDFGLQSVEDAARSPKFGELVKLIDTAIADQKRTGILKDLK